MQNPFSHLCPGGQVVPEQGSGILTHTIETHLTRFGPAANYRGHLSRKMPQTLMSFLFKISDGMELSYVYIMHMTIYIVSYIVYSI